MLSFLFRYVFPEIVLANVCLANLVRVTNPREGLRFGGSLLVGEYEYSSGPEHGRFYNK